MIGKSEDIDAKALTLALAETMAGVSPDATCRPTAFLETQMPPTVAVDESLSGQDTLSRGQKNIVARSAPRVSLNPWVFGPGQLPRLSVSLADPAGAGGYQPEQNQSENTHDIETRGILGQGGMGRVFLAYQKSMGREVAVKSTMPDVGAAGRAALLLEGRVTGSLEHPGIVPIHAVGLDSQQAPVLVMKRIEGVSWKTLLADNNHPAWQTVDGAEEGHLYANLRILMHVCNTLHFAHSRGVLHRDMKPENVMIGSFGEVYVVDWGVATRLGNEQPGASHGVVGTPAYLAPEMVSNHLGPVGVHTDVFLLGATLYELLMGEPPNRGNTLAEVLLGAYQCEEKRFRSEVPRELADLCQSALSKEKEKRPASALHFRRALADYLTHEASNTLVKSAEELLEKWRSEIQRNPTDQSESRKLAVECRFALQMALREWPENADAKARLQECLSLQFERAIESKDIATAHEILADIINKDGKSQRLEKLEQDIAQERAQTEQLAQFAKDMDFRVSSKERAKFIFGVAGIASLIGSMVVIRVLQGDGIDPWHLVWLNLGLFIGMIGAVYFLRKKVLTNEIGRRFGWLMLCVGGSVLFHRISNAFLGIKLQDTLRQDMFIAMVAMFAASVTVWRGFAISASWIALGIVAATIWPHRTPLAFSIGTLLGLVSAALLMRRYSESPPPEQTPR